MKLDRQRQVDLLRLWQEKHDRQAADELLCASREYVLADIGRRAEEWGLCAEDIVHDTIVVAKQEVESGQFVPEGRACFTTWCAGVARNLMLAAARKQRKLITGIAEAMEPRSPIHDDPAEMAARAEQERLLVEALSVLPNEPGNPIRTVFCLRTGLGVEGGRLVGVPERTDAEIGEEFGFGRTWASKKYTQGKVLLSRKLAGSFGQSIGESPPEELIR